MMAGRRTVVIPDPPQERAFHVAAEPARLPLTRAAPADRPSFRTGQQEEQVLIPLGLARYQLSSSWDRTVVLLTGAHPITVGAWHAPVAGDIVASLAAAPLVYGNLRVEVELTRPATPEARVVRLSTGPHLVLRYFK
jgi:hypothetical protein